MLISFEKASLQPRFQVPERCSTALAEEPGGFIVFNMKGVQGGLASCMIQARDMEKATTASRVAARRLRYSNLFSTSTRAHRVSRKSLTIRVDLQKVKWHG